MKPSKIEDFNVMPKAIRESGWVLGTFTPDNPMSIALATAARNPEEVLRMTVKVVEARQ